MVRDDVVFESRDGGGDGDSEGDGDNEGGGVDGDVITYMHSTERQIVIVVSGFIVASRVYVA